jgi:hypothetical protein
MSYELYFFRFDIIFKRLFNRFLIVTCWICIYSFVYKKQEFFKVFSDTTLLEIYIFGVCAKLVFQFIFLPPSQDILSENFTISSNASSKVLFFWFNNSQANFCDQDQQVYVYFSIFKSCEQKLNFLYELFISKIQRQI